MTPSTSTTIYTPSLHDALPISFGRALDAVHRHLGSGGVLGRQVSGVEGTRLRRRPFRPARSARGVQRPGTDRTRDAARIARSEEHTSELQSWLHLVCRLLLGKK